MRRSEDRKGARGSTTEVLTEGIEGLRLHLFRPGSLSAGPRPSLSLLLASVMGARASPTSSARSTSPLLVEGRRGAREAPSAEGSPWSLWPGAAGPPRLGGLSVVHHSETHHTSHASWPGSLHCAIEGHSPRLKRTACQWGTCDHRSPDDSGGGPSPTCVALFWGGGWVLWCLICCEDSEQQDPAESRLAQQACRERHFLSLSHPAVSLHSGDLVLSRVPRSSPPPPTVCGEIVSGLIKAQSNRRSKADIFLRDDRRAKSNRMEQSLFSQIGLSPDSPPQARTMAGPGAQLPHRPRQEEAGGWVLRETLSMLKYGGDR
ncbi:unnamed protein product [Pleuronectes platessa]|uniref:Uncharacterized protein n=1 Tax=Pleuronectes platessa TaxID=8262 RepID=A0A9N7YQV0_PLEPL|nr:unnamed protein product [Pleuronectes platessa]